MVSDCWMLTHPVINLFWPQFPKENSPYKPSCEVSESTPSNKEEKPIYSLSWHQIVLSWIGQKAGMKKRANPHMFRHSKATHMAHHLTEAQMSHYFGWVQGSDTPSTYVHLLGRDVDGAILKFHGLKEEKEEKKENSTPKKCHRCEKLNSPNGKYCIRSVLRLTWKQLWKLKKKWKSRII